MSILRTALKAPIAPRSAIASRAAFVRFASHAASAPSSDDSQVGKTLEALRLKDSRIPQGVTAYELAVPSDIPQTDFLKRRLAVEEHSVHTTDLWRKISYYICIPAILVAAIYVYKLEAEHEEHLQHEIDANGGVPPERKQYSYMNMRTKRFPWGNDALFFNPRYNIPVAEE